MSTNPSQFESTHRRLVGRILFQLNLQKSRVVLHSAVVLFLIASAPSGFHRLSWTAILASGGVAILTVAFFVFLLQQQRRRHVDHDLTYYWAFIDLLLMTNYIRLDGGEGSLFFISYLGIVYGVAFARGLRPAVLTFGVSALLYIGLLIGMGQIEGLDASLRFALGRLLLIALAAGFSVRGIDRLRTQRLLVRRLESKERLKVEALTALTSELETRNRELADKNDEVEQANRLKSQFLANMSHELRTPLNSIIGFTQILQRRFKGQIAEREERFIQNVLSSGEHLLGLINDLLDLSRIETGQLEVSADPVDIRSVAEGVRAVMQGVTVKRQVEIVIDAPPDLPEILTDAAKLKQILYNLLSNAIKFSPARAKVVLRIRRIGADRPPLLTDAVRFEVIDQGPGIAEKHHEAIFQEFRQLETVGDEGPSGTGLGLALVKRFVEYQGGAVWVESKLGEGSCFVVDLPLVARITTVGDPDTPLVLSEEAGDFRPGSQRIRIAVAEPARDRAQALATTLEAAGFEAVIFDRGRELLEAIRDRQPDAASIALELPDIDGWEILSRLRSRPETRDLPVVMVSQNDHREMARELGANAAFERPLPVVKWVERLAELTHPGEKEQDSTD